jgi:hypothetical protein
MNNKRIWKVRQGNTWVEIPMSDLRVGYVCKVYEPDGTPIYDRENQLYTITRAPYWDDNGNLTVEAYT